jgi:hypothetical protein
MQNFLLYAGDLVSLKQRIQAFALQKEFGCADKRWNL